MHFLCFRYFELHLDWYPMHLCVVKSGVNHSLRLMNFRSLKYSLAARPVLGLNHAEQECLNPSSNSAPRPRSITR